MVVEDLFYDFSDKEKNEIEERIVQRRKEREQDLLKKLNRQAQQRLDNISLWGGDERCKLTLDDLNDEFIRMKFGLQEKVKYDFVVKKLKKFCEEITKENPSERINSKVFIHGKAGTGKTFIAQALLNSVVKAGLTTVFINTNELKNLLYSSFNDYSAKDKIHEISEAARRCDLLMLDDLGTEASNKSETYREANDVIQQLLYEICNNRINKSIIITSNFDKDELLNVYNRKVISRLIPNTSNYLLSFDGFEAIR